MRKFVGVALLSALTLALPSAASAATITLASYTVTANNVGPGMIVTTSPIQAMPLTFTLNTVGQSYTTDLFNIGTQDSGVSGQELSNRAITVGFTFSSPAFSGSEAGTTSGFNGGFFTGCSILLGGCGQVNWGSPTVLNFGTTGQLRISLSDEIFGTPGSAPVAATFTLVAQDVPAVPEPASMILLGTGLLYGARRRFLMKKG